MRTEVSDMCWYWVDVVIDWSRKTPGDFTDCQARSLRPWPKREKSPAAGFHDVIYVSRFVPFAVLHACAAKDRRCHAGGLLDYGRSTSRSLLRAGCLSLAYVDLKARQLNQLAVALSLSPNLMSKRKMRRRTSAPVKTREATNPRPSKSSR